MDVAQMMKQKSEAVDGLTKGIEGLFKKNKVRPSLLRSRSTSRFRSNMQKDGEASKIPTPFRSRPRTEPIPKSRQRTSSSQRDRKSPLCPEFRSTKNGTILNIAKDVRFLELCLPRGRWI